MRQPRCLRGEQQDPGLDKIAFAKFAATEYLRRYLSEEEKQTFRSYIDQDPFNWFELFDRDTGGVLGKVFKELGYTEDFFGVPTLTPIYSEIIREALVYTSDNIT